MQALNRKRRVSLLLPGALFMTVILFMSGCVGFFNRVADTVLANEVRFDDREAPRTAHAIAASSDLVQLAGGQGLGLSCSLPWGAQRLAFHLGEGQAPIALQMRQACAFHDYCYRHGNATYGYSQADCDFMLQQQAFRLCKFINHSASISKCETDARKVTLGVRLGGWGNFQNARALDGEKASTFLEFDPYPVKATGYRVVRIADAPQEWVRDRLLRKAAYHFDIRPSGSLVHVLGWKSSGELFCSSFTLPASYHAINGAPMVVRDAASGEDWFVWWRRSTLAATHGHFALLPPGRAAAQDWVKAAGGFAANSERGECEHKALYSDAGDAGRVPVLAFTTANGDQDFSEIHPVRGTNTPGKVRLMGLSTHKCGKARGDVSPCLVDIEFDTARKRFVAEPASPRLFSIFERNCGGRQDGKPRDDCDRYRNYVAAPWTVSQPGAPSLVWLRRGAGNGDGYDTGATLRRYAVGQGQEVIAADLGELTLTEFPETMEPALMLNPEAAWPTLLSIVPGKAGVELQLRIPARVGKPTAMTVLDCKRGTGSSWRIDASWLRRPPAHVPAKDDPARSYLVFSRVAVDFAEDTMPALAATLELTVATIANGKCSVHEQVFHVFDGFASDKELAAMAAAASSRDPSSIEAAREAAGRFAERVRGGQMVLADVSGDGVPDLVQVARVEGKAAPFRSVLLLGNNSGVGLHFDETGGQGLETLFQ